MSPKSLVLEQPLKVETYNSIQETDSSFNYSWYNVTYRTKFLSQLNSILDVNDDADDDDDNLLDDEGYISADEQQ